MASSPDVHCNAANLRSGAKPDVEEDLIEEPLGMEEDDTSLWRWGGKHRYHGGRHGYNKHHYGGYKNKHHYGHNKHHYGHNKHHYGGYKNKHHYGHNGWGYPPQSPLDASAM